MGLGRDLEILPVPCQHCLIWKKREVAPEVDQAGAYLDASLDFVKTTEKWNDLWPEKETVHSKHRQLRPPVSHWVVEEQRSVWVTLIVMWLVRTAKTGT